MPHGLPSLAIVRRATEPVRPALRKRRATSSVMVPTCFASLHQHSLLTQATSAHCSHYAADSC
jgi:hypothetical protein